MPARFSIAVSRPRRCESFSITTPAQLSGTSATTSSTGSQVLPSTSRVMISGRETLNS